MTHCSQSPFSMALPKNTLMKWLAPVLAFILLASLVSGSIPGQRIHKISGSGVEVPGWSQMKVPNSFVESIAFRSSRKISNGSFQLDVYTAGNSTGIYRRLVLERLSPGLKLEVTFKDPANDSRGEIKVYSGPDGWKTLKMSGGKFYTVTLGEEGVYLVGSASACSHGCGDSQFPVILLTLAGLTVLALAGGTIYYRHMERMSELEKLSTIVRRGVEEGAIPRDEQTREVIEKVQEAIREGHVEEANRHLSRLKDRIVHQRPKV